MSALPAGHVIHIKWVCETSQFGTLVQQLVDRMKDETDERNEMFQTITTLAKVPVEKTLLAGLKVSMKERCQDLGVCLS